MKGNPRYFPVELQDLFNHLVNKYGGNNQICWILKLNGRMNEILLQQALRLSLDIEPILGCCFIEDDSKPIWKQREDLDSLQLCSVVETQDIESELQKFIGDRFDPTKDCQVKARIVRAESDTLCLKIHHACSDAGGFKQFLQLVASIYDGLFHNQPTMISPHSLKSRDQKQILNLVTAAAMTNDFQGGLNPSPTVAFPCVLGENTEQSFALGKLDSKQFYAVKEYARNNSVTMNDILLTAFNRTLSNIAEIQNNTIAVNMTIDLRRYLPKGTTAPISNLSSASLISIHHDFTDSFCNTLSKVSDETKKMKADNPGIRSALFLETIASVSFKDINNRFLQQHIQATENKLATPFFSNIGIIDDKAVQFGLLETTECYMVGPATFSPNFVMLVSTYADTLTLSTSYFQSSIHKLTIDRFIETMLNELRTCEKSQNNTVVIPT